MEVNGKQKDWRLVKQENYLKNKAVTKATFKETNDCDHAHCAFCWEKLESGAEGYRVVDGPWWICGTCYHDFKEQFCWYLG